MIYSCSVLRTYGDVTYIFGRSTSPLAVRRTEKRETYEACLYHLIIRDLSNSQRPRPLYIPGRSCVCVHTYFVPVCSQSSSLDSADLAQLAMMLPALPLANWGVCTEYAVRTITEYVPAQLRKRQDKAGRQTARPAHGAGRRVTIARASGLISVLVIYLRGTEDRYCLACLFQGADLAKKAAGCWSVIEDREYFLPDVMTLGSLLRIISCRNQGTDGRTGTDYTRQKQQQPPHSLHGRVCVLLQRPVSLYSVLRLGECLIAAPRLPVSRYLRSTGIR